MKRILDITLASIGLLIASPLLITFSLLIWLQDRHSPIYKAQRVGKDNKLIHVYKLRSMIINADKTGVNSTSANDNRITKVGRLIRTYKIDELMQLWNVILGNMSIVGPRPNVVKVGVSLYTKEEMRLLSIKPGITDFASIVFSDQEKILKDEIDPNLAYNQLVRPWKSQLGLFYIDHQNLYLDLQLTWLTVLTLLSKPKALNKIVKILEKYQADPELIHAASRKSKLVPHPPPGSTEICNSI